MIIDVCKLPNDIRLKIQKQTNDLRVDIIWSNGCNEEGEDYYEVSIDSEDNQFNYFCNSGWGNIETLEEALEELE